MCSRWHRGIQVQSNTARLCSIYVIPTVSCCPEIHSLTKISTIHDTILFWGSQWHIRLDRSVKQCKKGPENELRSFETSVNINRRGVEFQKAWIFVIQANGNTPLHSRENIRNVSSVASCTSFVPAWTGSVSLCNETRTAKEFPEQSHTFTGTLSIPSLENLPQPYSWRRITGWIVSGNERIPVGWGYFPRP